MSRLLNRYLSKTILMLIMCGFFLSYNAAVSQAAVVFVTDPAVWEDAVSDMEVFETNQANIEKADEVFSLTGLNDYIGGTLTFRAVNTGLSRGFVLKTLQPGAGFTFNDTEGGVPVVELQNALSVGDSNDFEDDDWQLTLLDGASIMAFAFEIRGARFAPGESMTLYSGNDPVGSVDLSSLPSVGDENYFFGLISDVPFDRVSFDEDPDGDDIGIADFRFANVLPSEIEAVVDINPDTINLKSRGRYVTAYIELPEGYSVEEIDRSTVVISGIEGDIIDPALHTVGPWQIGDYDQDGIADLMVKFDRQELIPLLKVTDKTITVSGELTDGTLFNGTDNSRIIKHRKFWKPAKYRHLFRKWNFR